MKTKLIAAMITLALISGCVKEDEPKPTKKGSKWGIIYRDSTHVDTVGNQGTGGSHVRR